MWAALATLLVMTGGAAGTQQPPLTTRELAAYQLTEPAFRKFAHATRLMLAAIRSEPRFADAPLFTKDILVSGDAAQVAAALGHRLDTDPLLATALFAADLGARDYTSVALTIFAARLAHGFIQSGVLRAVPAGIAEHNVRFVAEHEAEIVTLLRQLGVEDEWH